ncbi:MAG: hypothetical protein LBI82_13600 [Dysgonamonadaceae bacterium]|jgi:hypothetical protein|nr:hypothetical protein [Dysgonamonadaceae bacterium]
MKTSKKLNQIVSGVLSTSILTASCTQYSLIDDRIYDNKVTGNLDLGEIAIPISLELKPEDIQYIKAIQRITIDILNSPKKAKAFNENPKSVLKNYGYNGDINLDDNLLRITMALADEDIHNAIKNQDFKTYVKLCKEKGIISSTKGIFADEFYQEQLRKVLKDNDITKLKDQLGLRSTVSGDIEIDGDEVVSLVLVFFLVIVAGMAIVVAVWAIAAFSTKTKGVNGNEALIIDDLGVKDLYDLKLYTLEGDAKDSYIVVDEYTEEIVDNTISIIKEMDPDYFTKNSEIETRNLVKINAINSLYQFSEE